MGNFCSNHPILALIGLLAVCNTAIRMVETANGVKHSPLINIKFGGKEVFDISRNDEPEEELKQIKKKKSTKEN